MHIAHFYHVTGLGKGFETLMKEYSLLPNKPLGLIKLVNVAVLESLPMTFFREVRELVISRVNVR